MPRRNANGATSTRSGVDSAVWSACDVLRRSNCAGALRYVPELTWLLFLRSTPRNASWSVMVRRFGRPPPPAISFMALLPRVLSRDSTLGERSKGGGR